MKLRQMKMSGYVLEKKETSVHYKNVSHVS